MSKITHTRATTPEPIATAGAPMPGSRIDAAHVLGDGPAREPASAESAPAAIETVAATGTSPAVEPQLLPQTENAAPVWTDDLLARLRVQGRQLAERLRERQNELDIRAENNRSQLAELENEIRAARLWLIERQQELTDRETQLADRASRLSAAETYHEAARQELTAEVERREESLARREQDVAAATARLERQTAALADAQRKVEDRRQREHQALVEQRQQIERHRQSALSSIRLALAGVEERRAAVERKAAALEESREAAAAVARRPSEEQQRYARDLQAIAERLATREAALDESQRLLERAEIERVALRCQLEEDAERLQAQSRIDRRRLLQRRRESEELASRQQEALRQKQLQLDERQLSLDRLRDELAVVHREALDTRAAAEEALVQLAGPDAATNAALTQSLNETRHKLSEQWRKAAERGAAEQAELASLGNEITGQLQKLRAQKEDLDQWTAARERSFAQQAAALAEREEQTRAREALLHDQREAWSREREDLEQRLRATSEELTNWSRTGDCRLAGDAA
ncbi:MAG TPA: hypothetical protein VGJ16_14155 [Pirellulales bacterium]